MNGQVPIKKHDTNTDVTPELSDFVHFHFAKERKKSNVFLYRYIRISLFWIKHMETPKDIRVDG